MAGPTRVELDGAYDLATRLAGRYWDLSDPSRAATLESWRSVSFVRIVIDAE